jgi:hypothetical protein
LLLEKKRPAAGWVNLRAFALLIEVQAHRLFGLSQIQSIEQRSANSRVYDQPISVFKSRDRVTGL